MYMKPELLSPAGSIESFYAAIEAGCDAVYIGGTNDPSMVKYFASPAGFKGGDMYDGPYLTTNDGLVEFN